MSKRNEIQVRAGDSEESITIAETYHTAKIARQRAKYLCTGEFAARAEMSEPFAFVGVYVDGELREEFTR